MTDKIYLHLDVVHVVVRNLRYLYERHGFHISVKYAPIPLYQIYAALPRSPFAHLSSLRFVSFYSRPALSSLFYFVLLDLLDTRGNSLHLSDEAKLNLYETIGFLIGMPGVPVDKQVGHPLCRAVPCRAAPALLAVFPVTVLLATTSAWGAHIPMYWLLE